MEERLKPLQFIHSIQGGLGNVRMHSGREPLMARRGHRIRLSRRVWRPFKLRHAAKSTLLMFSVPGLAYGAGRRLAGGGTGSRACEGRGGCAGAGRLAPSSATGGPADSGTGWAVWRGTKAQVGVHGGAFVPGPGLVRGGVGYAYTRFSLGSPLRIGGTESKTLGHVAEIRLSVQVFTPVVREVEQPAVGVLSSAFESGAAPDDAVSGAVALGVTRRFSSRLSAGFGALLLHQLDSRAVTVVPIALVDWQITDRLVLRSRRDARLTYLLDARQRLSVAGVVSLFDRKQFRLDDSGAVSGGTVEIGCYAVGGRVTWRPAPGLALEGGVEAPLGQSLRVRDRSGREVFDTDMDDGLQLSVSVRYRF